MNYFQIREKFNHCINMNYENYFKIAYWSFAGSLYDAADDSGKQE